jgi:hypothetical protein
MTGTEKLLDINLLENLELNTKPEEFSKLLYHFILALEFNITKINKFAKIGDFDDIIKITSFLDMRAKEVGATLLSAEIVKLHHCYLKKQNMELLESVKDMTNASKKTISSIQDILLITFCFGLLRTNQDHCTHCKLQQTKAI